MTDTSKPRPPTHRIYAVTRKDGAENDAFWQPIGAAWAHRDNKGLTLKLELFPLTDAEIVIRAVQDRAEAERDQSAKAAA